MNIINIYGGPGVGKSTAAAMIFAKMKMLGINCELVTEYAKTLTYEKRFEILQENQLYVFAKQYRQMERLKNQTDLIITDSPLLLSKIYSNPTSPFHSELLSLIDKCNSFIGDSTNIILARKHEYKKEGRSQSENEAIEIHERVIEMLKDSKQICVDVEANEKAIASFCNTYAIWYF